MDFIKPLLLVVSLVCLLTAAKDHRGDGPLAKIGTLLLIVGAMA
ncbi:MAG: hypothetical protein WCT33_00830 [Patescibacteria group bacterium]|jgi:hypothetical protein